MWFPSAFGVLEKAVHGMDVLLPLVGGRLAYNHSHLMSSHRAPQSLEGALVKMIGLGHVDVCSYFYNIPEICLFIICINNMYEALFGIWRALWLLGCALVDAVVHYPGLVSCCF